MLVVTTDIRSWPILFSIADVDYTVVLFDNLRTVFTEAKYNTDL